MIVLVRSALILFTLSPGIWYSGIDIYGIPSLRRRGLRGGLFHDPYFQ
mgnify:CR=1 FL=1